MRQMMLQEQCISKETRKYDKDGCLITTFITPALQLMESSIFRLLRLRSVYHSGT